MAASASSGPLRYRPEESRSRWPSRRPQPATRWSPSRGQIAYTLGEQLIVLNSDLSRFLETNLGFVANVLAFSPDGRRLAFSDPDETISWIDLDTGKRGAPPAGELRGYQPRFSPDGQALLARRSNGEITAWRAGLSRNFGYAAIRRLAGRRHPRPGLQGRRQLRRHANAGAEMQAVRRLSLDPPDPKGDAAIALNASVMALNAADGVSLADARTGLSRQLALAAAARAGRCAHGRERRPPPPSPPRRRHHEWHHGPVVAGPLREPGL